MAFHNNERLLAGFLDGQLTHFTIKGDGLSSNNVSTFKGAVASIDVSEDGSLIAAASTLVGPARVFDGESLAIKGRAIRYGASEAIRGISIAADNKSLALASSLGEVRIVNLQSNKVRQLPTRRSDQMRAVAFSPYSQVLASVGDNDIVSLWRNSNWESAWRFPKAAVRYLDSVRFSSTSDVTTIDDSGNVWRWSTNIEKWRMLGERVLGRYDSSKCD